MWEDIVEHIEALEAKAKQRAQPAAQATQHFFSAIVLGRLVEGYDEKVSTREEIDGL